MRIAIVGSGISGMVCAHLLRRNNHVTVFEAEDRPGGHANTVRVDFADETHMVDTGFIVYNNRNYPGLRRLFEQLGVATKPSEMSFSFSDEESGIEWRGTSIGTVFAQRRNALNPRFLKMILEIQRFNRLARDLITSSADPDLTLASLVEEHRFSDSFVDWYLIPLGSSIWSADPGCFLETPALTHCQFFANHGLLGGRDQPRWRTVDGGSKKYVDALLGPLKSGLRLNYPVEKVTRHDSSIEITSAGGSEDYDHVILATHSDQALKLLSDATDVEHDVLGAIRYTPNRATLHTDENVLPRNARALASWNYFSPSDRGNAATLTYRLNSLQGIDSKHEILVTLNLDSSISEEKVISTFEYAHPVLDAKAVAAQRLHGKIMGNNRTWFCGAYWGYGFHEDGVQSALRVCRALGGDSL